ncbi:MAG: sodium:proton antiporter [Candidatus Synechococcus spongiarum 142]|uniref:Iron-sulfur cluster carrier protein n=1 Tax=Candidatus Synechococcus spongiarum 142 TaxID=1608213 RepID=A0A6N3XCH2_9SYNE|nr:MAG: sodium:proton antiporter [Candidatus Synechococcus spongiarum 142]
MTTISDALTCLRPLTDAGSGKSVLDLEWIRNPRLQGSRAIIELALPSHATPQRDRIAKEARTALLALDGVEDVQIELAAPPPAPTTPQTRPIVGVKTVVAISSGKGGVGKSTVAVNLACALATTGLRVGLLDADLYGPNTPIMLGLSEKKPTTVEDHGQQLLLPLESCGIAMVSMGLLINPGQPVIWRGPMLNGVIRQFLYQVKWGERDVLVVDLPPGTGDAQLSLAQAVPMEGVVIVTTPQQVALADSRRGLAMFQQLGVPILGVVENMSWFAPPDQPEKRYALFGEGGGAQLAAEARVPLLAQLPLQLPPQEDQPLVLSQPDSPAGVALQGLAQQLRRRLMPPR